MPTGYVYIITNVNNKVLYIGVTSDLLKRINEHRQRVHKHSFSDRYNLYKLVYFEKHDHITDAIAREKRLKGSSRKSKVRLIEAMNPEWKDLYIALISRVRI